MSAREEYDRALREYVEKLDVRHSEHIQRFAQVESQWRRLARIQQLWINLALAFVWLTIVLDIGGRWGWWK